ncbi:MAG: gamma carbonic anhydrase family protein [Desulfobacterales bacterium]|nr:gamma carbonic anhydrase family protein [Desulfobacterales bacterium]
MTFFKFENSQPICHATTYIAPTASIIGNVVIGEYSSVWFNCVIRGDAESITIGNRSNIQDITVLHADPGLPITIGNQVTIGHRCIIHGCTIEDNCIIGMGAVVMNGSSIGCGSIIAAGSVILENTTVPPFSLFAGIPGKIKQTFNKDVMDKINYSAEDYVKRANLYRIEGKLIKIN